MTLLAVMQESAADDNTDTAASTAAHGFRKSSNADSHFKRGLELHKGGSYAAAIREYDSALELNRQLLAPRLNMAIASEELGKMSDALDFYTMVLHRNLKVELASQRVSLLRKQNSHGAWTNLPIPKPVESENEVVAETPTPKGEKNQQSKMKTTATP